jgi:hypothetical protein
LSAGVTYALTSTPDRFLLIVSRGSEELANYLQQHFKGDGTVRVVVDRRQGNRRQSQRERPSEETNSDRRRNHRRARPDVDKELRLTSFAIVTLPPESPPAVEPV